MPAQAAKFALDEVAVDGLGGFLEACMALGRSGRCGTEFFQRLLDLLAGTAERGSLLGKNLEFERIRGILPRSR